MPHLDLTDEEEAVLAVELVQLISRVKYPFSDRIRTLGAILNKLRPEPARGPLPSSETLAPSGAVGPGRRQAGPQRGPRNFACKPRNN